MPVVYLPHLCPYFSFWRPFSQLFFPSTFCTVSLIEDPFTMMAPQSSSYFRSSSWRGCFPSAVSRTPTSFCAPSSPRFPWRFFGTDYFIAGGETVLAVKAFIQFESSFSCPLTSGRSCRGDWTCAVWLAFPFAFLGNDLCRLAWGQEDSSSSPMKGPDQSQHSCWPSAYWRSWRAQRSFALATPPQLTAAED